MLYELKGWAKPAIVGIAFGVAIVVVLVFSRGDGFVDVLTQYVVQRAFGDTSQLISKLSKAGSPPWLLRAAAFAIGIGLPYMAGAASTIIAMPALRWRIAGRPLIEHCWPGLPDILNHRLEMAGADLTDPYAPKRPFLGRQAEIQALMRFSGPASGERATIAITGIEGIGKTRISLVWLARLKALGWDTGILKKDVSLLDVERAVQTENTEFLEVSSL